MPSWLAWIAERWVEIGALLISAVSLRVSLRAQRVADLANRANVTFHLICEDFSEREHRVDLVLVSSNLSSQANTLVKARLELMDGPPGLFGAKVYFRDRAGMAVPLELG